jgi:hypothetical protein
MKVRWTAGSVRFRITPGELASLAAGEAVSVSLPLPGSAAGWRATLRPETDGSPTCLCGDGDGRLVLHLAAADIARLSDPAAEGVYFRGPLGDGEPDGMRFFVEKDFPCAHPRPPETAEEDASGTFAPPPGFVERHRTCAP